MFDKLDNLSPRIRVILGWIMIVIGILSFIAGPVLVLCAIVLSATTGDGRFFAIYFPTGVLSFFEGFGAYALGDLYKNYDNNMQTLVYVAKYVREHDQKDKGNKTPSSSNETTKVLSEAEPSKKEEPRPEHKEEIAKPKTPNVKGREEFEKEFRDCVAKGDKTQAYELVTEAFTKGLITDEEYNNYFRSIN
jgi:hypothetical protein